MSVRRESTTRKTVSVSSLVFVLSLIGREAAAQIDPIQACHHRRVSLAWGPGIMPIFMDKRDGGTVRLGLERSTRYSWFVWGLEAEHSRFRTSDTQGTFPPDTIPAFRADVQRNISVTALARVCTEYRHMGGFHLSLGLQYNSMRHVDSGLIRQDSTPAASVVLRRGVVIPMSVGFSFGSGRIRPFLEGTIPIALRWPAEFNTALYPVGASPLTVGVRF